MTGRVVADPLLTPQETADRLGVTVKSIGRYRRAGLLKAVPLPGGRSFRYRTSVVQAILDTPGDPQVAE